jgi:hypothetical protein
MEQGANLRQDVHAWIQAEADKHFGGDWVAAAASILESAREAEMAPDDPWAYLSARTRRRGGR